jgi:hypothetical protein
MLALLEGQPASSKENESLLAPLSVFESFHIRVFIGKGSDFDQLNSEFPE